MNLHQLDKCYPDLTKIFDVEDDLPEDDTDDDSIMKNKI